MCKLLIIRLFKAYADHFLTAHCVLTGVPRNTPLVI
jgi:hypothetical protein